MDTESYLSFLEADFRHPVIRFVDTHWKGIILLAVSLYLSAVVAERKVENGRG